MKLEELLRKLARSSHWQVLYNQAKNLGSLNLFNNSKEFTKIQIIFLSWIDAYNSLYKDLANEEDYITEKVLEDDIRTDAYLYWRRKVKYKQKKKENNLEESNLLGIPKVIFKSKKGSKL